MRSDKTYETLAWSTTWPSPRHLRCGKHVGLEKAHAEQVREATRVEGFWRSHASSANPSSDLELTSCLLAAFSTWFPYCQSGECTLGRSSGVCLEPLPANLAATIVKCYQTFQPGDKVVPGARCWLWCHARLWCTTCLGRYFLRRAPAGDPAKFKFPTI
jgi:hypothetical protein